MKSTALLFCLAVLPVTFINAQLSLTPQFGFESSKSNLIYNGGSSYAPLGSMANLNGSLRIFYNIKKAGGPYASVGTSPAVVQYSFADAATALNNYEATTGPLKWRVEAGYQFSSKPISLESATSSKATSSASPSMYMHHRCGGYRQQLQQKESNTLNMRIQPSVGFAYRPGTQEQLVNTSTGYQYSLGSWKTAAVGGIGLQFAKGRKQLGTVALYYTKGLGNSAVDINSSQNGKSTINNFSTGSSSWALTFGLPFTLGRSSSSKAPQMQHNEQHQHHCGQMRYMHYRCSQQVLN
jgi:hypothetical protein